jgi:putative spermidine/putrescine transport system substrate-binding protein
MNMLRKIKPYVKVWASSGSQQQQAMASGEVGIAVMWESRIVPLATHGYSYWKVSWTGSESESDFAFLVPKGAPDAGVSFAFLKWIALHPRNQGGFSAAIGTFTPGKDVLKYVPKDLISWQPQSHAGQVFYWPSLPWVKRATELQNAWQSTVG